MKIEILISTMNRRNIEELELETKNIFSDCLIVNQITTNNLKLIKEELTKGNVRLISFRERGLSISRNRALEKAKGDILLLTDDDVYYKKNFEKKIMKEFEKDKNLDILTFKAETSMGEDFKRYSKKSYTHNRRSILKVSSIEIAIRKSSVEKFDLKYDELFGLGSLYETGEENIFLQEALKKGCSIKFVPISVAIHSKETSNRMLTDRTLFSKGALFFRLFGWFSLIFNLSFILKKRKKILTRTSLINAMSEMYRGTLDYIRRCKCGESFNNNTYV
ncbi:hypothetical protein PM10SUCC1_23120 [Propionigenium maris DSM 9537]|uniref:Glycosyltransferase 2-like domain-containing protein n=1 Tax=Propionigenium maris DSM 9537 TaxID=1123000 RepID=A0A9W6GKH8_9FUSO|nr:glycosyltransferase family 2 protein [Propionigenium maris]GLI56798.1 hypothetical protein PM10SUCC1_23120 [Propionigenium maris DSM 9537]